MEYQTQPTVITVSVAMCTYNGEAFLEQQLESVVQQTYPLKELLIFDDASTDGTVNILNKYASKYSVIKLQLNKTNIGFTRNFQQVMLAASGDAIAICDQDDVWMPDKIGKMILAWKPGVSLIYCYSYLFQAQLPVNPVPNRIMNKFYGTDARKLCMYNTVSGHAIIFRKELLQLAIPFSDKVTYDWWLAVVAACNGGVQYLPEVLVCQRLHNNNVTLDDHKFSKAEISRRQKQEIIDNNLLFSTVPNISNYYKSFFLRLSELAKESLRHRFYKPLFLFLIYYRQIIFHHKKRKISFFSHVKHSFRRTINK